MEIIEDRRALHKIPELVRDLPKTMAYLQSKLNKLPCRVFSPMAGCLCAFFDFGADHAIGFRCDADALPITEKNDLPFASTHPGKMHACGHDGHMAILLELARRLDKKQNLPHNVLLVFQPAEEEGAGGRDVCRTGIFEEYHVKAIFALHLWPGLEKGRMFSRPGEFFTHSCEVTVDIAGRSSHIAKPSEGVDALEAGMELYRRVRELEKALPPEEYRILNFGLLKSGTVRNAISAHTHMEGSLRAFSDAVFSHLYEGIFAIAREVEQETGCAVKVTMNDGYPAVINPPELYEKVQKIADFGEISAPFMTAEDFSWYQKHLPGMLFCLGLGDVPALHADTFNFDDEILVKGADFFEDLAENFQ